MHAGEGVLLLLLLGAVVILLLQGFRLRRYEAAAVREQERQLALRERSARAVAGESDAARLLESAGYAVLARQVAGTWMVHADGEPQAFDLRADYLVGSAGRQYIAEVKTGRTATRLSHGPTRRQLLEYWAAFDVDGVLLVDADRGSITHVELDPLARLAGRAARPSALRLIAGFSIAAFIAGLVVGAAAVR